MCFLTRNAFNPYNLTALIYAFGPHLTVTVKRLQRPPPPHRRAVDDDQNVDVVVGKQISCGRRQSVGDSHITRPPLPAAAPSRHPLDGKLTIDKGCITAELRERSYCALTY